MSRISTEIKKQERTQIDPQNETDTAKGLSFSPIPQTYTSTAKDVSFSYVQTDSLRRLNEDINSIQNIKSQKIDWFSMAIGVAPTALIGVISNWSDNKSIGFIANFIFLIGALIVAIVFLFSRKNQTDIAVINERLERIKKDLSRIFEQSNIEIDHINKSSSSDE